MGIVVVIKFFTKALIGEIVVEYDSMIWMISLSLLESQSQSVTHTKFDILTLGRALRNPRIAFLSYAMSVSTSTKSLVTGHVIHVDFV